MTRVTDRLATFLTLAGLTALLTGGLGIALTVETHLARRTGTIATLKCLGAVGGQVFAIYLGQVMLLAVAGVVLGLALGLLLPLAVRLLPEGACRSPPISASMPGPAARGAAGLLTTFVFALWPLAIAREVSPASLFRALVAPVTPLAASPYLVADGPGRAGAGRARDLGVPQPSDRRLVRAHRGRGRRACSGPHPAGAARRPPPPHRGGFALRLALANLHRPGSPSPRVIVALGAGVTAAGRGGRARQPTCARGRIAPAEPGAGPLPDRYPAAAARALGQVAGRGAGQPLDQLLPSLRARVVRIAGRPVAEVKVGGQCRLDGEPRPGLHLCRTVPEGTELVAGSWWPPDYAGPPLVSIDEEIAAAMAWRSATR